MKTSKIIFTLAITLLFNFSSFAQAQKIGHVNSNDIIMAMPERDSVKEQLEQLLEFFKKELSGKEGEYTATLNKYKAGISTMAPMVKEATEAKLVALQDEINSIQQSAQTQLQEQEMKMLEPLQKKVKDNIDKVAKAGKFSYIFDISTGVALYHEGGIDITELVKKEMGIKSAPATTNTATPVSGAQK